MVVKLPPTYICTPSEPTAMVETLALALGVQSPLTSPDVVSKAAILARDDPCARVKSPPTNRVSPEVAKARTDLSRAPSNGVSSAVPASRPARRPRALPATLLNAPPAYT